MVHMCKWKHNLGEDVLVRHNQKTQTSNVMVTGMSNKVRVEHGAGCEGGSCSHLMVCTSYHTEGKSLSS